MTQNNSDLSGFTQNNNLFSCIIFHCLVHKWSSFLANYTCTVCSEKYLEEGGGKEGVVWYFTHWQDVGRKDTFKQLKIKHL